MSFEGNRGITPLTVKSVDSNGTVVTEEGVGFGASPVVAAALAPGMQFIMETLDGSRVTGIALWIEHKSDEELAAEQQKNIDRMQAEHRVRLQENESKWQGREDALPDWLKERIAVFHERGGDNFKVSGWDYELTIAELAVFMADGGDGAAFAEENGLSGHQFGFAQMLATAHSEGKSLAESVSALTPITGEPYYAPRED